MHQAIRSGYLVKAVEALRSHKLLQQGKNILHFQQELQTQLNRFPEYLRASKSIDEQMWLNELREHTQHVSGSPNHANSHTENRPS